MEQSRGDNGENFDFQNGRWRSSKNPFLLKSDKNAGRTRQELHLLGAITSTAPHSTGAPHSYEVYFVPWGMGWHTILARSQLHAGPQPNTKQALFLWHLAALVRYCSFLPNTFLEGLCSTLSLDTGLEARRILGANLEGSMCCLSIKKSVPSSHCPVHIHM